MSLSDPQTPYCSFCRKSQAAVAKLISTPNDDPRAYICDECVRSYTPEEQQGLMTGPAAVPNRPSHCLICHPDALQLLAAIERWALAESERRDAGPELAEMRRITLAMLGMDPA